MRIKKLEDIFGYSGENVSEMVWRVSDSRSVVTEVQDSSFSVRILGVTDLSQGGKVESSEFWCFKDFEFLATALVNSGGGIRNRKGSITDESEKTIGQKLLAGATSVIERWF